MNEKQGLRIEGNLDEINPFAKTTTGKPVCSVKIDGKYFKWWELKAAKEFAEKLTKIQQQIKDLEDKK